MKSAAPRPVSTAPLSVVIPTLGGEWLTKTIDALNRGTVVADEILICIPREHAYRVRDFSWPNVKILETDCKGQVAQRALGFRNASQEFVMQLDDDMLVDEHCVAHLLGTLEQRGPRTAVAPSLVSLATGESIYRKPRRNRALEVVYYWLMNGAAGYRQGRIEKSGSAVGVDAKSGGRPSYDVEWLAGGCVMHRQENLVTENFYPFPGKAYCEDIIHSHHLKARGIRLVVDANAICRLHVVSASSRAPREFLSELASDFRARKHYMQISSSSSPRLYVFYLSSALSYLFKRFLQMRHRKVRGRS